MKKLLFIILPFFIFSFNNIVNAQDGRFFDKDSLGSMNRWSLRLGFNSVDSNGNGSGNPFNNFFSLDEEAYHGVPLKFDIEYRFSELFALEVSTSANKWIAGEGIIDGILLTEDQNYFALDAGLKLYYDEAFNWLTGSDWLELYFTGGLGYFKINEGGTTANLGLGANIWFSNHFGFNINAAGKWALNTKPALFDTNHTQYSIGLSYRFEDQDKDNDGVYDYNDYCPNVPGTKETNGCPDDGKNTAANKITKSTNYDSDNDGVVDNMDKCPNVAGLTSNNGCPMKDSDGDGVIDSADKCPMVSGSPSNNGCPIVDSDGDGVVDSADNCPTVSGATSNNGCPISTVKEVVYNTAEIKRLSKEIRFNTGKDSFTSETYSILQSVISFVNRYPNSKFRIEGHTDSIGSYEANRKLSQRRADAVKAYLVSNGVPSYSLEAIGMGERQPIATNMYKDGREQNRRVEIIQVN